MEDLNVMGSVYGNSQDLGSYDGFNYAPQPQESLLVRATKKYTASKAASEEEKRRADAATLGTIASDIQARQIAERQKFDTLEASIARTQAMLEGPPPAQTPQLGTADYAAMLLQAVAGGGNQLGQSYQNLMGMRGQETQVANQNAQDAWRFQTGRTQDEIESLRRLQNQALEGAQYYERAGLTNQMAQAEFAQNQAARIAEREDTQAFQLGMTDRKLGGAEKTKRLDMLKAILGKVSAENRPAVIGQMGLGFDEDALEAMSQLTEGEQRTNAQTANTDARTTGQILKNQFDSRTMEERINQLEMKGDILELEKTGKGLSNDIATIRKENLPAEYNARINNLNARAAKANSGGTSPQGRPMAVGTAAKLIEKYHANNDLSNAYNEEYGMLADLLRNASMGKNEKEVNRIRNAMNGVRAKMIVAASNANAARIAADRSGINVDGNEQITAVNPGPTGNIGGGPQVKVTSKKQNPASSRGKTYKTKTGGKFEF